jgi:hypothetical protein
VKSSDKEIIAELLNSCAIKLQIVKANVNGQVLDVKHLDKDNSTTYWVKYEYSNGLLSEKIEHFIENKIVRKSKYIYKNDKLANLLIYDNDDPIPICNKKYEYDNNNKSKEILCDFSGEPLSITKYVYNKDGLCIEEKEYDDKARIRWKKTFVYNRDGDVVSKIYFKNGTEMYWSYINEYDRYGRLTSCLRYNEKGNTDWNYNFKYNKNGNMLSKTNVNSDKKKFFFIKYDYDAHHNRTKKEVYNYYNKLTKRYTYVYDNKGDMICENILNGEHNIRWKVKYKYDKVGRKIEDREYNSKNRLVKLIKYYTDGKKRLAILYNNSGNYLWLCRYHKEKSKPIKWFHYDSKGKVAYYNVYKYDDNANLIKEVKYNADKKLLEKKLFTYDEKSQLMTKKQFDGKGKIISQFP